MSQITWEEPFCQDSGNCFRLGTDDEGNGYVAVVGQEERPLVDSLEALRALIRDVKAGKVDHLL